MEDSPRRPRRLAVASWALYDLANTLYSFVILSFYFSPWLTADLGAPDSAVGVTQSLSMVVVIVLAPILGAVTDRTRRMPFLVASTAVAVACTALLGIGSALGWAPSAAISWAILFFALSNIGFQLGLVFYDALLPSVSTPHNVGRVGALGVAVGYLGSFVGLVLGTFILTRDEAAEPYLFVLTALFFLFFSIPCFLFVRERANPAPAARGIVKESLKGVLATLRTLPRKPAVARFLISRVLYADAINTFVLFLGIYAVHEAGFETATLEYSLLLGLGILFAVLGAPVWGALADRIGPRTTLLIVLAWWMATLGLVVAHPVLALPRWAFFVVGPMTGIGLGGTWSADRPLLLRLAPAQEVGQYYGLYALAGRFAAITGPLVWALVVDVLGLGRPAAVGILGLFIVAAALVLRRVPEPPAAPRQDPPAPQRL